MQIGAAFRIQLFQVVWIRIHNINFNQRTNMGHNDAFLKLHLIIISTEIFSFVQHSDLTSVLDPDPAKISDPDLAKVLIPDPA
jgi:hypothetical protein